MKTVSCFVFADLLNLLANSCYSCSFNLRICKLVVERSHPPAAVACVVLITFKANDTRARTFALENKGHNRAE